MSRDRALTQPASSPAYSPLSDQKLDDRAAYGVNYGRDPGVRKDEYPPFRTGFRNTYLSGPQSQPANAPPPNVPEQPRSHPPPFEQYRRQADSHLPPANHETIHGLHRGGVHSQPPEHRRESQELARGFPEQHGRVMGEEMQRSRSFLSIGSDASRRGRASPLPQAVQGVQAQYSGPSGDPSIKSEFGRIFQGLGSGLGGHIPGSSTPSRQSPMPQRGPEDAITLSDNEGLKMARVGSRGGAKGRRRIKDEDRMDGENVDGRGTPLGTRGGKRPRMSHAHHLPLGQQQPHGFQQISQEGMGFGQQPSAYTGKFNANPQSAAIAAAPYNHIPSPQTHIPKPAPLPFPPPMPKPQVTVHSQSVIDMVKDRPRRHLGSEVYAPVVSAAGIPVMPHSLAAKSAYRSIYQPSREFSEDDWNCTFTIRVPRYYLSSAEREKVCADRNLFGTAVYTDDSDPLAVAVHSGWIRGEWADYLDTSLLDIAQMPDDIDVPEEMDKPLEYPVIPPENCEAHITMQILPTLEHYKGSILNGIKSRSFGRPSGPRATKAEEEQDAQSALHDGCSYRVHKIRWVDEGMNRGFGRTAKDKRKHRARETLAADALLSMFNGPDGDVRKDQLSRMEGVELTSSMATAAAA